MSQAPRRGDSWTTDTDTGVLVISSTVYHEIPSEPTIIVVPVFDTEPDTGFGVDLGENDWVAPGLVTIFRTHWHGITCPLGDGPVKPSRTISLPRRHRPSVGWANRVRQIRMAYELAAAGVPVVLDHPKSQSAVAVQSPPTSSCPTKR